MSSFNKVYAQEINAPVANVTDIEGLTTVNNVAYVAPSVILPVVTDNFIPVGTGLTGANPRIETGPSKVSTSGTTTTFELAGAAPGAATWAFESTGNVSTFSTLGDMVLSVPVGKTIDLGSRAKATTPSLGDNDTSVATTAFVQGELAAYTPTPPLWLATGCQVTTLPADGAYSNEVPGTLWISSNVNLELTPAPALTLTDTQASPNHLSTTNFITSMLSTTYTGGNQYQHFFGHISWNSTAGCTGTDFLTLRGLSPAGFGANWNISGISISGLADATRAAHTIIMQLNSGNTTAKFVWALPRPTTAASNSVQIQDLASSGFLSLNCMIPYNPI